MLKPSGCFAAGIYDILFSCRLIRQRSSLGPNGWCHLLLERGPDPGGPTASEGDFPIEAGSPLCTFPSRVCPCTSEHALLLADRHQKPAQLGPAWLFSTVCSDMPDGRGLYGGRGQAYRSMLGR